VAVLLEQNQELVIRRRVKKIAGAHGTIRPPGDIDVLAVNPKARRVTVIECKNLAVSGMPHEISNELENLFRGRSGKTSGAERHQKRVGWVRDHLDEVLAWLGLKRSGRWKVESLIVIDRELMSPYIWKSSVSVKSFGELEKELAKGQNSGR